MMSPIEIAGIAAMAFSNLVAYAALRRLKQKEKRADQHRINQQKWVA